MPHNLIGYLVMLVALGLIIRRNMRGRRLRVEALWVMPVAMIVLVGAALSAEPMPGPATIALFAAALLIGGAVGWQRGRFTRIELDPATHSFTSRASPAGMIFIAVLFIARFALRLYVVQTAHNPAVTLAATDALLLFAAGLVAVQRIEMWLRCRRMLAEVRGQAPLAVP